MAAAFQGTRLIVARTRRELYQNELAERCDVYPQAVLSWEAGTQVPTEANVTKIVTATEFPTEFFYRGPLQPLEDGEASFRARSKFQARKKRAALAAGAMAGELAEWIEGHFELPGVQLPDLTAPEVRRRPDLVAKVVRDQWMLGSKPIPDMIRLLESRGVLVFSLAQDVNALDAFSFWHKERPIVLLNRMKSPERSRMDAAHELAHLVCHRNLETDKVEERDANIFAGTFLMPEVDIIRNEPRIPSLSAFMALKQRWRVSLSALIYRMHELERLSDWKYRMLFMELSKRGYLDNEPHSIPRETSTVLSQAFTMLKGRGVTPATLSRELAWPRAQLDELIFGSTILSVAGGGQSSARRKGHLQLVKRGS